MTTRTPTPDGELLADYAFKNSETAFGSLVARHAAMVFATAVRQLGESSLAEEVTQNTFLALARKAPRLSGNQTLAGWLHRSTLLEAKACFRKELRRRRREETAAALACVERDGDSPTAHLVPLLDEALLDLRDSDRQALVLRFLEGCSLRDVGNALGVEEDAARKRVSRALERVGEFFRRKGFLPAGGTTAVVSLFSAASAQTMPAGLAIATTQAVLAGTFTKPGLTLAGIKVMALSKTPTAVVAVLLVAAPLTWQWRVQANLRQQQVNLESQSALASRSLGEMEMEIGRRQEEIRRAEATRINTELRLAERRQQLANRPPPPVYRWDDASPLMRIPKSFIEKLSLTSTSNRRGKLNQSMIDALQLTEEERQRAQDAIDRFRESHSQVENQVMQVVEPHEEDLEGRPPERLRVFEVPYDSASIASLREDLFADLRYVLGPERFPIFQKGLSEWMPLDDGDRGISSAMAVVNADHRLVFFRPGPGENSITWRMKVEERGSLGMTMDIPWIEENFPRHLITRLQDWIDLARPLPGTIVE